MTIDRDPMFVPAKVAKQHTHGVAQSRESHDRQAAGGVLERRQRNITGLLTEAGPMGLTALEIEKATGEGHGKVSGALSAMHRGGLVAALKIDRRNNYGVYVLPGQVGNRLVRAYQPNFKPDTRQPAPAPAQRERLNESERELIAAVRKGTAGMDDQPFLRIKPKTLKTLLAAIDRLSA